MNWINNISMLNYKNWLGVWGVIDENWAFTLVASKKHIINHFSLFSFHSNIPKPNMRNWKLVRKHVIKTIFFSFSFHGKHKTKIETREKRKGFWRRRAWGEEEEDHEQASGNTIINPFLCFSFLFQQQKPNIEAWEKRGFWKEEEGEEQGSMRGAWGWAW